MKIHKLVLETGVDIPYQEAQLVIHQPSVDEIALVGEEQFLMAIQFLTLDKSLQNLMNLGEKEKRLLSNFDIFMMVINSPQGQQYKNNVLMLFALLFPQHTIKFAPKEILLANKDNVSRINKDNYNVLQDIIRDVFQTDRLNAMSNSYNPADKRAARIAEKLSKRKVNQSKKEENSLFEPMLDRLSVGLAKDKNVLKKYTVYQLFTEFERFQKKIKYEYYLQIATSFASSSGMEEPEYWM